MLGSSIPSTLTSIVLNSSYASLRWSFASDNYSTLNYQVVIRKRFGDLVFNETLSVKQFEYNIPDPCDHYNATVTAVYGYQNQTCLQSASVQIFGGKEYYYN